MCARTVILGNITMAARCGTERSGRRGGRVQDMTACAGSAADGGLTMRGRHEAA